MRVARLEFELKVAGRVAMVIRVGGCDESELRPAAADGQLTGPSLADIHDKWCREFEAQIPMMIAFLRAHGPASRFEVAAGMGIIVYRATRLLAVAADRGLVTVHRPSWKTRPNTYSVARTGSISPPGQIGRHCDNLMGQARRGA